MLIYQPQCTVFFHMRQPEKERTLHSPKPRTSTRIDNKNNNINNTDTNNNNDKHIDDHISTRFPSPNDHAILQLPRPLIIPSHCDGDGGSEHENEKTTVTLMARMPRGGISGLIIEYVQLVPAGRGDPRAVEAEAEDDETESGESMVQQLQEQVQLVDRDDWVDESWCNKNALVVSSDRKSVV